jgi:hypothetical protein
MQMAGLNKKFWVENKVCGSHFGTGCWLFGCWVKLTLLKEYDASISKSEKGL